jgi:hypothetical protein
VLGQIFDALAAGNIAGLMIVSTNGGTDSHRSFAGLMTADLHLGACLAVKDLEAMFVAKSPVAENTAGRG